MTTLHVVVGELIPKSFAIFATERWALRTATPLIWFYRASLSHHAACSPRSITNAVVRLTGHDPANEHDVYTGEEIQLLIDEKPKAVSTDPEQNEFVDNIFDLGDKDAEAIMTSAWTWCASTWRTSLEENLQVIQQYKYTRYPCRGHKDRIVGFVHVKDLHTMPHGSTVNDLNIRSIEAVPEACPSRSCRRRCRPRHQDRRGDRTSTAARRAS